MSEMASLLSKHPKIMTHNFYVTLDLILISCSSVTNIESAVDYDTIQEGGVNDHVHTWVRPYGQQHRLVMESAAASFSHKLLFYQDFLGHRLKHGGSLILYKDNMLDIRSIYTFDNPMIVRWEGSTLAADQSAVYAERIEIVHDGLRKQLI